MKLTTTQYGFEYGAATVERLCSDDVKGWIALVGYGQDEVFILQNSGLGHVIAL